MDDELGRKIYDWASEPYHKGNPSPFSDLDDSGIFYKKKKKSRLDTRFLSSMELRLASNNVRVKALDAWFVSPSLVSFFNNKDIRAVLNKAVLALNKPETQELANVLRGTKVHRFDPALFRQFVVAGMLSAQKNAYSLFVRSALILAHQFAGVGSTNDLLLILLFVAMIGCTTYLAAVSVGSGYVEELANVEKQVVDSVYANEAIFAGPVSKIIQNSLTGTVEEIAQTLEFVFLRTGGGFLDEVFTTAFGLVRLVTRSGPDNKEIVIEINTNNTGPYELQIQNPDQFTKQSLFKWFAWEVFDLLIATEGKLDSHGKTLFIHTAQDFGANNPRAIEEIVKPLTPLESIVFFHIHLAKNPRIQTIARLVVNGYAWVALVKDPELRLRMIDEMVAAFSDKTGPAYARVSDPLPTEEGLGVQTGTGLAAEFAVFTALLKFRYGSVEWTDKMTEQLVTAAAKIASLPQWTVAPFSKIVKRDRFDRTLLRLDRLPTKNMFKIEGGDRLVEETVELLTHNKQLPNFRSYILSFANRHGIGQQTLAELVGFNSRPSITS